MKTMIHEPVKIYKKTKNMSSGSYREGFRLRLRSSDEDIMVWSTLYKLIDNSSECIFTDALRFNFFS